MNTPRGAQSNQARRKNSRRKPKSAAATNQTEKYGIQPGQSVALLKALHILTRDGKLNQDSRRKLKQIQHLVQFITPLLDDLQQTHERIALVDHGAGKSYLGFLLYDLYFKTHAASSSVIGIEQRPDLVQRSEQLARDFGFDGMQFLALQVADSTTDTRLPQRIDIVTALHACDTATDDAIAFGLAHDVQHMVLVPCCQAEVASLLKKHRSPDKNPLALMWRHPLHTREFGSHITNVLRGLQLQAHGYKITVTELVGWEHSMKNELIIASKLPAANQASESRKAKEKLAALLEQLGMKDLPLRFAPC